jgi:hypothetical protein
MQRFLFISMLTFLMVFTLGGGLLIVASHKDAQPEIQPIQVEQVQ